MLAINTINYYTFIKDKLLEIEDEIRFIQENGLMEERQNIVVNVLNSKVSTSGNNISYIINKPSSSLGLIESYKKKFATFKKEFNVLAFFGKLATIRSEIRLMFKEYNREDKNVISMLDNLNELAILYQNVIQSDDKKDVVIFFDATEKYVSEYWSVISSINEFISILTNEVVENIQSNTRELEIQLLDVKYTVGEFAEILQHLDVAYSTFARLIPNAKITQLQIVKIESGSLLSKILGDDNVIEVLGYVLKKIADCIFYKFTTEGKIALNSQIMQQVSNDAEILEKLRNAGVNVDEGQQNLSDTFNVATRELYNIASKTPRIKIDNEELKVHDTQKYLEYSTKYLIENNDIQEDNEKKDKAELQ